MKTQILNYEFEGKRIEQIRLIGHDTVLTFDDDTFVYLVAELDDDGYPTIYIADKFDDFSGYEAMELVKVGVLTQEELDELNN